MTPNRCRNITISLFWFLIIFALSGCNPKVIEGNENEIFFKEEKGILTFYKAEKPILSYQTFGVIPSEGIPEVYLRGGYIHPVYTPLGKIITGDYPYNHLHHHGIWAAWTKTQFEGRMPDFWNMGDSTGTVKYVRLDSVYLGPKYSGFQATHHYVDLSEPDKKPQIVLEEQCNIKIYNLPKSLPYFIFDLNIFQLNVSSSILHLPKYHYGGMGFRGAESWDGEENTEFMTSEGKTRIDGNETRGNWCHIGGLVDDEWVGITIMNHITNFRSPQPMRIHPTEPFFCFAPSQMGDWSIEPSSPYQARYRFIVYDGKPDTVLINRLWADYIDNQPF
ncbi:MAG: PmoA family protein [Bacteroidota bacterium]|nr:PmoA family protein [Bacteroidota bacterium]